MYKNINVSICLINIFILLILIEFGKYEKSAFQKLYISLLILGNVRLCSKNKGSYDVILYFKVKWQVMGDCHDR